MDYRLQHISEKTACYVKKLVLQEASNFSKWVVMIFPVYLEKYLS